MGSIFLQNLMLHVRTDSYLNGFELSTKVLSFVVFSRTCSWPSLVTNSTVAEWCMLGCNKMAIGARSKRVVITYSHMWQFLNMGCRKHVMFLELSSSTNL